MPTAPGLPAAIAIAMLVTYLSPSSDALDCGESVTRNNTIITSPDFPDDFPSYITCKWVVQAPPGRIVELHLQEFNVTGDNDMLAIFDGAPVTCGTPYKRYNKYNPPKTRTLRQGPAVTIVFQSGDDSGGEGFQITVVFLPAANIINNVPGTINASTAGRPLLNCNGTLRGSGRLTSPNYPATYPPNARCVWHLLPNGSWPITLHIISLQLESPWDTLRVYRSATPTANEQPIAEYTGNVANDKRSFSGGSAVTVVFTSDESTELRGFEAVFYSNASSPAAPRDPLPNLPFPGVCGVRAVTTNTNVRIVGGAAADPSAWPWQVLFKLDGYIWCGGSLITAQWVVTAAHCFKTRGPEHYTVILGKHNRNQNEATERHFNASKIIVHPSYDTSQTSSDIALVKLSRPVTFNDAIRPVCLPLTDVAPGTKCFATGWGKTEGDGSNTVLQQVALPTLSFSCCNSLLSTNKNVICAGYLEGGEGTCNGDSGGPLVSKVDGYFYLYGVTASGGRRCAEPLSLSKFTRTTGFISWIKNITSMQ